MMANCLMSNHYHLPNKPPRRKRAGYSRKRKKSRPLKSLKNQIYQGSDQLVDDMPCNLNPKQPLLYTPKTQKLTPPKPFKHYQSKHKNITEAMARVYLSGHYTLAEVGLQFSVSYVDC